MGELVYIGSRNYGFVIEYLEYLAWRYRGLPPVFQAYSKNLLALLDEQMGPGYEVDYPQKNLIELAMARTGAYN